MKVYSARLLSHLPLTPHSPTLYILLFDHIGEIVGLTSADKNEPKI